jgi:hypothetical protein
LKLISFVLAFVCLSLAGCNPFRLPGLRQVAKQEEERETKETEEAIRKSPALQELDRLCTQEIPRPDGFVLVKKFNGFHSVIFVGYGYHSGSGYQEVKTFYMKYFTQHGWLLTKQEDGSWGPMSVEFSKDSYKVVVDRLSGGDGLNYDITCEKPRDSAEER